jgi:hypothetical protein
MTKRGITSIPQTRMERSSLQGAELVSKIGRSYYYNVIHSKPISWYLKIFQGLSPGQHLYPDCKLITLYRRKITITASRDGEGKC